MWKKNKNKQNHITMYSRNWEEKQRIFQKTYMADNPLQYWRIIISKFVYNGIKEKNAANSVPEFFNYRY